MTAYWNCISKSVAGEAQYSMAKFSISSGGQVAAATAGAKQSKLILGQSSVLPGEGKYSLRSCWGAGQIQCCTARGGDSTEEAGRVLQQS